MKTTTITREYDDKGRLVRETRVEMERPDPTVVVDDGQWWQPPRKGWWQNPIVSYVNVTRSDTAPILVN